MTVAGELDERIIELRRRLSNATAGAASDRVDALRELGPLLMRRYLDHGLADEDRDAALGVFGELLTTPDLDARDAAVAHLCMGHLIALRVLPSNAVGLFRDGAQRVSLGEVPDLGFADVAGEAARSVGTPEELADLDDAIGHLRCAVDAPALPDEVARLAPSLLGVTLLMRSLHSLGAGTKDADRAGEFLDRGAELWPAGTPGWTELVGLTRINEAERARRSGVADEVDDAIDALEELAAELPAGHALLALILNEAGLTMAVRAARTESADDMAAGPLMLERALDQVRTVGETHPLYDEILNNLGGFSLSSTAFSPTPEAIERVVELATTAARLRSSQEPAASAAPRFLLAMATLLRATSSGSQEDFATAAEHLRFAATHLPAGDRLAPTVLVVLGSLLVDRHSASGGLEDAGAASFYMARADALLEARRAEGGAGDDLDLLIVRGMRGFARTLHAGRTEDPVALDGALEDLEFALARIPESSPWCSRMLLGRGMAYLTRGVARADLADLRRGADAYASSFEALPAAHPHRPFMAAQRGLAVFLGGLLNEDPDALDQGLALLEEARVADTAGFHLKRSRLLQGLGMAYLVRADRPGARAGDLDTGIERLEEAWQLISEQPGQVAQAVDVLRLLSNAYRRRADPARNDPRHAVDAGIAALREVVCEVLLQVDAEDGLLISRGAAADAHQIAVWCLEDGRLESAIEALELGRGLVLHTSTSATTVPELLRAAGHPELADEWSRAPLPAPQRPWRNQPSTTIEETAPSPGDATAVKLAQELGLLGWEPPSDLRHRALAALKGTAVAGSLLLAPTPAELAAALCADGTDALVYLLPAFADDAGHALLVRADEGIDDLQLHGLRIGPGTAVDGYAVAHHQAVQVAEDASADSETREQAGRIWRDGLDRLCDWAWPAAMGPILDAIAARNLGRPPRLALVPAGTLGIVPWHAARRSAGSTGRRHRYACQQAVISYAATGRQFAELARRERVPLDANPVLVADPTGDLYWARKEVEAIRAVHYPRSSTFGGPRSIASGPGVPDEILSCLPGFGDGAGVELALASVLHLACHARTGRTPTESYLELAPVEPAEGKHLEAPSSTPLPVSRILRQAHRRPPHAPGGLVVLSACRSDLTDHDHDEAVTLATALIAAGTAGVVGSRWMVDGVETTALMFMFHHHLRQGHELAGALRSAQLWMLDPDRAVPVGMPLTLVEDLERCDPTAVHAWAAFTAQGH